MKKRILYLLSLGLVAFFLITGLYIIQKKSIGTPNYFNRQFKFHHPVFMKVVDLGYNSYYFSGADLSHLYLGNETAPLSGILLDTPYDRLRFFQIKPDSNCSIYSGRLFIDSPFFFLNDQSSRVICQGAIDDWTMRKPVSDKIFSDLAVSINNCSLAIRTLDGNKMEYILGKKSFFSAYVKTYSGILQQQNDGIFSTDGTMFFDAAAARLVYLYYYRNQFICLDSNLNLVYRGHTIDTTSWAKLDIVKIRSDNSYSIAQPPMIVNRSGCISDKKLFIHSLLMADNEKREVFEESSVIDIYDLESGSYQSSFYIPDYDRNKVKDFRLIGNRLIVVAGRYLLVYEFDRG